MCSAAENNLLTWESAVNRVFERSPRLKISSEEIDEISGFQIQSSALPNPVASYSVENVFGVKEWRGWHSAESRYEIAQLVELGGKRGYRSQSAGYLVCASLADYEAEKLRVLNQLTKLFLDVVFAQELVKLTKQQEKVSEEVFISVRTKVEEGRTSIIQQNKAEIGFFSSKINAEKALVNRTIAKERLSILWGESCPDFDSVEWPFYEVEAPVSLETCQIELPNHPELLRSQFEYLSSQQNYHLEKADNIPDLVITLGYKTANDTGNKGFILGASIPLNVFNQNQGNIQKARSEYQKREEISRELSLLLQSKLLSSHKELVRAYNEVEQIRKTILTSADKSFEFSKEGYIKGKFEYLDMLDSQKILFDIHEQYIEALLNYHKSKANIKYLNSEDASS